MLDLYLKKEAKLIVQKAETNFYMCSKQFTGKESIFLYPCCKFNSERHIYNFNHTALQLAHRPHTQCYLLYGMRLNVSKHKSQHSIDLSPSASKS